VTSHRVPFSLGKQQLKKPYAGFQTSKLDTIGCLSLKSKSGLLNPFKVLELLIDKLNERAWVYEIVDAKLMVARCRKTPHCYIVY